MTSARLVAVMLALHAALFVAAGLPAFRNHLWGFNAWTFLTVATIGWIVLVSVAVIALLRIGRPGGSAGLLVGAAIAALLVVGFRDTTHLLGDGQLWLAAIRERPAHHPHEPLAFGLATLVTRGDPSAARLAMLSHVAGLMTLGLLWLLAGRLVSPSNPSVDRRWVFAILATTGASLFFFGYVEAYPTLGLVVVALLLALVRHVQGHTGAVWVGGLLGLAIATHATAVALVPAVLIAFWRRRPGISSLGMATLLGLVPIGIAWIVLPRLLPDGGRDGGGHWTRLLADAAFYRWGFPAWVTEQVNRWGLAAGVGPGLLLAGLAARGRLRRGTGSGPDDVTLVLSAATLGLVAPALILDMEGSRGAAADWDAFAIASWPLAALAARGLLPPAPPTADRDSAPRPGMTSPLFWVAPVLGLFGLLAAAQVAHRPETAVARFESLITGSFRTPRARSWGWETVAAWRRESGDMPSAARAYESALAEQPRNVRLLRNTAGALGRIGESRRAADVLARLAHEVPDDPGVWLHLGMELEVLGSVDSSRVALRRSLTLDPNSIDARNELAGSLIRTPDTRREARELIAGSLEKSPGQAHAPELRRMLERLDRDGYGPTRAP